MPRSKNGKQPRTLGPDDLDITNALNAIKEDMGADAELHIYMALDGRMFVECSCVAADVDKDMHIFSNGRFVTPGKVPFLVVCMQTIHRVYHDMDNSGHRWPDRSPVPQHPGGA